MSIDNLPGHVKYYPKGTPNSIGGDHPVQVFDDNRDEQCCNAISGQRCPRVGGWYVIQWHRFYDESSSDVTSWYACSRECAEAIARGVSSPRKETAA